MFVMFRLATFREQKQCSRKKTILYRGDGDETNIALEVSEIWMTAPIWIISLLKKYIDPAQPPGFRFSKHAQILWKVNFLLCRVLVFHWDLDANRKGTPSAPTKLPGSSSKHQRIGKSKDFERTACDHCSRIRGVFDLGRQLFPSHLFKRRGK